MRSFKPAIDHLRSGDPVLAAVIDRVGACRLKPKNTDHTFVSLAQAIVSQQLSIKAAATIFARFTALFPDGAPDPSGVSDLSEEQLREVGLSRQKIAYLRDLAGHFQSGAIIPSALRRMSDEDIIETLTKVKGIGRWTAEMFLIFTLNRPNVLPVDDLGFRRAVQREYGLPDLPVAEEIRKLAVRWEPYCSIATWYLWASLENAPM
jgi:DNA-3-methyladenine glycosylase II